MIDLREFVMQIVIAQASKTDSGSLDRFDADSVAREAATLYVEATTALQDWVGKN
jgi:hypothetical protein